MQAFRALFENGRLLPECADVKHYEVDGTTYLARTDMKTTTTKTDSAQ